MRRAVKPKLKERVKGERCAVFSHAIAVKHQLSQSIYRVDELWQTSLIVTDISHEYMR